MTANPRRADDTPEGPFRGPERLALAMPLTAALGLTIVMAAAALGQSAAIVALASAAGFALCALAPIALMQVYVVRPLRLALAHLRAARDGAAPPAAPPPPGVIADLVAAARDIGAAQANIGQYRAGVALCETMAAAGDEAIRAFRLQCEELAETTAQSESQSRRAAQEQFAEVAEALKACKPAAPSASLDSGVERIEQMLVYLAETLERRERPPEGEDRIDGASDDLAQLIGREAQAIRETVAAAAAGDKAAHDRQLERLEMAEANLLQRIAEVAAPAPDVGWQSLRDDLESAATGLGEAIAGLGARLDGATATSEAVTQAVTRGLGDVAERLREQGQAQTGRLDEIEARLLKVLGEAGRDGLTNALSVLAKCTDKLRNALDRFDVLAAAVATEETQQGDQICAAVRALEGEVAGFGDRLAQGVGSLDFPALRQDFAALGARVGEALEGVAARVEASGETQAARLGAPEIGTWEAAMSAQGQTLDALRADVAAVAPRVGDACEGLARRLDGWDTKSLPPASRDLAAVQARCESFARQIAVSAAALAALAEREGHDFEGLRAAFDSAGAAMRAQASQAQASQERERSGAWAAAIENVVAQAQDAHARLGEALAPLDALAPAVTALHVLTRALEASTGQVASGVEGLQAIADAERPEWSALRESVAQLAVQLQPAPAATAALNADDDLRAELRSLCEAVSEAASRLDGRLGAPASAPSEGPTRLAERPGEAGPQGAPALVGTLREQWRTLIESLADSAAQSDGSPWRADLDALGARLSETLTHVERRLAAVTRPYPELASKA